MLCLVCKKDKPITDFWKNRRKGGGYQRECKVCSRKRSSDYYVANKDRIIKNNVEYSKKSRDLNRKHHWFKGVKERAKMRGMVFSLRIEDIEVPKFCPILGIPIDSQVGLGAGYRERGHSPSIDRIDNSRGYEPDNVVVVSLRANRLKSDATMEELRLIADWYDGHRNGKKIAGYRDTNWRAEAWREPDYVSAMLSLAS